MEAIPNERRKIQQNLKGIRDNEVEQAVLYGGINNLRDEKIDDVLGSSSGKYFFTGVKITFQRKKR